MRQLEFSADAQASLSSMLGALRSGNEVDFVSPLIRPGLSELGKEEARDKVGKSIFDFCTLSRLPERLRILEEAKLWKFGNLSRRPAYNLDATSGDSVEKQVLRYFDPLRRRATVNSAAMSYAVSTVLSQISPLEPLRPLNPEDVADEFPNSGMGFPILSSQQVHRPRALSIAREIWDSGADPRWVSELPAIAGYRGQPRGRKQPTDPRPQWFAKTRLIYMMPRASAIVVQCVRKPLFEATRHRPQFCAWNRPHDVDVQMTKLLADGDPILSIDFKGFDQSVPFELIDVVFDIIGMWFVGEASPLIDFCREEFKRTGILTPGRYHSGDERTGGIPSGSVFTNWVGSVANSLVLHYAAHRCGNRVKSWYTQGDDGAVTFARPINLDNLAEVLLTDLGMTISPDKTLYVKGAVHFLQNLHCTDFVHEGLNVGVRPLMQLANPMTSYERVDLTEWKRAYDTVRFMQQILQGVHHPMATQMCDWLYEHDWCVREVIERVLLFSDKSFADAALTAVSRKDSALRFWGNSPGMFVKSPVVLYLGERVKTARLLKGTK